MDRLVRPDELAPPRLVSLRTIDVERAEASFHQILRELPLADGQRLKTWRAPSGRLLAVCASHRPSQTGGIRYWHFEPDRFAMYSGRPIVWTDDFEADGRANPRPPLLPPATCNVWRDALDGRFVVARYDDSGATLDLYTDPLGACHLYSTSDRGTQWFSNNAELLRRIIASRTTNPLVLASLVGCGWSFGGQPAWRGSTPPPARSRCTGSSPSPNRTVMSSRALRQNRFFERGFVAEAAARTLAAVVRALSSLAGRPSSVSLDRRARLEACVRGCSTGGDRVRDADNRREVRS